MNRVESVELRVESSESARSRRVSRATGSFSIESATRNGEGPVALLDGRRDCSFRGNAGRQDGEVSEVRAGGDGVKVALLRLRCRRRQNGRTSGPFVNQAAGPGFCIELIDELRPGRYAETRHVLRVRQVETTRLR